MGSLLHFGESIVCVGRWVRERERGVCVCVWKEKGSYGEGRESRPLKGLEIEDSVMREGQRSDRGGEGIVALREINVEW